ncbi:MAG: DNA repair protein RadA [Treponema sp.]|jgi:DNA repair protein RadA/Sms|nr:DNA repair protein RadA [Treponema sp.]
MKKQKAFIFRCSSCGHEEPKWLGRCPECGEWNTLIETAVAAGGAAFSGGLARGAAIPQSLPLASVDPQEGNRTGSGIPELDRVLGGGIMKRQVVLIGGEPGIGKSTLLLQIAAAAETRGRVLYISGEESAGQVRMRADRLGIFGGGASGKGVAKNDASARIEIVCSGRLEDIEPILNAVKPVLIMVDSAQTLFTSEMAPGTINQMKYCSFELISWVKEHDAALFLAAHVTKEGIISGPKTLEHMVDTVLYFEQNEGDCRFLRAVKNRFGSVDEIGIFTMGEGGLSPVEDTGRIFLIRREGALPPGVAVAAILEGTRTLLVEIQALTVPAKGAVTRVFSDKIDSARVSRVAAALEKHLKLRLSDQDIYVNVAGGIRINEVGSELALACAIYSARTGLPLPAGMAIAGELSLTGEIRPVRRLAGRIKTARNLGFAAFLGPTPEGLGSTPEGLGPAPEGQDAGGTEPAGTGEFQAAGNIKSAIPLLFRKKE